MVDRQFWCASSKCGRVQVSSGRWHWEVQRVLWRSACGQRPVIGAVPQLQETQWGSNGIFLWRMSPKSGHSWGQVHERSEWQDWNNQGLYTNNNIQTIIIIHVFRMTTSFLTHGREPSLASQLGSESWCVYIFTLMFVQKFFLCIIETIIQCRWWLWHFPCSPHACATACSAPYSPSLVSSRFRFSLISCSNFCISLFKFVH